MNYMSASGNSIEIRNLTFTRNQRVIFHDVDINIQRGKVTAIMGPSGTGKTTLLKLIGGQLRADHGSIFVEGRKVDTFDEKGLYLIRRQMGMLFQSGALFTHLNVFDNVAFPLREHSPLSERMIRDIVLMKLQAVGLRGARHLMPSELSGGMARRVALARAIALDPSIIMYDEPFSGQDPISMGMLVKLVRLLNDALGMTTVIVSHDVQETVEIADYIYLIAEGRVVGEGAPKDLLSSSSGWVQQFMQGLSDGPVPFHYPSKPYFQDLLGEGT